MKVLSIASGSKGNCTFVKAGQTSVLIDAGICFDKIEKALEKNGEDAFLISAVLLTHSHIDHARGLYSIVKHCPNVKIYAHQLTIESICKHKPYLERNFVSLVQPFFYAGDLAINSFFVSHDTNGSLCFSIFEGDKKFSLLTDLGTVGERELSEVFDSDLIFIEANHCVFELKCCPTYPRRTKERILSDFGHLSNDACGEFLCKVFEKRKKEKITKKLEVGLCHISENTNSCETALAEVNRILADSGFKQKISIAFSQNKCSEAFVI